MMRDSRTGETCPICDLIDVQTGDPAFAGGLRLKETLQDRESCPVSERDE